MRAVILAGGKGTRLRPYTTIFPKPLVPLGNRPVLEIILRQLARHGFTEIDLCIGHLGELIMAYFAEGTVLPPGVQLRYYREDEPLGTAGALGRIDAGSDDLLVMNGDVVTTLDFGLLMRFHREQEAALTIATTTKDVAIELGVIDLSGPDVVGYTEKPRLEFAVSMGVYVYSPRAFAFLPEGASDFPDLVRTLLSRDEKVAGYRFAGEWFDIGTPGDHERAQAALDLIDPPS